MGIVCAVGIQGFERRLEHLIEGTFARVFRSGLNPVELGRKLVRTLDDKRSVGVNGRVIVPNDFTFVQREADVCDGGEVAVILGEVVSNDHDWSLVPLAGRFPTKLAEIQEGKGRKQGLRLCEASPLAHHHPRAQAGN